MRSLEEIVAGGDFRYAKERASIVYHAAIRGSVLLGCVFGVFGIILVVLGSRGSTRITLVGLTVSTENAGIAVLIITAAVVGSLIRRALRAAEELVFADMRYTGGLHEIARRRVRKKSQRRFAG